MIQEPEQSKRTIVHDASHNARRAVSIDDALDMLVAHAELRLGAHDVMLLLIQDDRLYLQAGRGIDNTQLPRVTMADGTPIESWVAVHGTPLISDDVFHDPRLHHAASDPNQALRIIAVPIQHHGCALGVLEVGLDGYAIPCEIALTDLERVADVAGFIMAQDAIRGKEEPDGLDAGSLASMGVQETDDYFREVRHSLRTPLTAITGYAQLVQRRAVREGRAADAEYLDRLLGQVRRMSGLLDGLRGNRPR